MMTTIATQHQTTNPFSVSVLVKRILASNIQYLDHQINRIARPFQLSLSEGLPANVISLPIDRMEEVFSQYEYYSRKKWLLFHVQSLLTHRNASLILTMLSDNYLCEFDKEEIEVVLNGTLVEAVKN